MATENEKPQEDQVIPEENPAEEEMETPLKPAELKKKTPKKPVVVDVKAKEAPRAASAEEPLKAEVTDASPKEEPPAREVNADQDKTRSVDRSALVFGGGLLVMGVLLMLGRLLEIPFSVFLWPFIFIVPGGLVLLASLSSEDSSGEGLSILGGILTSLGLVLLVQSITGLWASWTYAWTLIAPTSVGFSQMLYGQRRGRAEIVNSGRRLINLGLTMFAVGFVFFEMILGVSGFGLNRLGLPVFPMVLIFAGLVVLIRSFKRNRK